MAIRGQGRIGAGLFCKRPYVPVTQPPAGLDVSGTFSCLAESLANAPDGLAQALVVDFLAIPKFVEELLAVNRALSVFDQVDKDQEGFALQGNGALPDDEQLLFRIKLSQAEIEHGFGNVRGVNFAGSIAEKFLNFPIFLICSELGRDFRDRLSYRQSRLHFVSQEAGVVSALLREEAVQGPRPTRLPAARTAKSKPV